MFKEQKEETEKPPFRAPLAIRLWAKVDKTPGLGPQGECWEWQAARSNHGYGVVRHKGRNYVASRVSWETKHGPIPDGLNVLHRCDNPPCVRLDHLFLGTHADNTHDMLRKNRSRSGGKLNPEKVREIRRDADTSSVTALAQRYGVDGKTIREVISRHLWNSVQ